VSTEFTPTTPPGGGVPRAGSTPERVPPTTPLSNELRTRIAATLRAQASNIAERWEAQSRTVALRQPRQDTPAPTTGQVAAMVTALAAALGAEGWANDDLVGLGLAFGTDAFELGSSLHHALKGLDLLSAMILYAVETSLAGAVDGTMADGVRVSRRLQQATSLLTLAATKGYTEAMSDTMRDRFRHLRHDLRNPLGTIKSVLAMMDDETMPADARAHPRFRAMAKRNARTLGELIADRLSDAEATVPTLAHQSVSLRAIACGVRRDLRAYAEARAATIVVGNARARVLVDAIGLELLLHELLLAALQETTSGDELHLEFGEIHDHRAVVLLHRVPARPPVSDSTVFERCVGLAEQMHATVEIEGAAIRLLFPVRQVERATQPGDAVAADHAASPADAPSGHGKASHDVRGAQERDHGQSRAL
jgi:signal transduction histidine kinase